MQSFHVMYWDGPSTIVPGGQSLCGGLRVFLTWQLHCPDGHSNNSRKRVAFLVLYVFFTVCVMRVILGTVGRNINDP